MACFVRIGWWFRGVGETLRVSTVATYFFYLLKSGHTYLGLLLVLRRHISIQTRGWSHLLHLPLFQMTPNDT